MAAERAIIALHHAPSHLCRMELLLLRSHSSGEVLVAEASAHAFMPAGYDGRVIGPGGSYLGIPYQVWADKSGKAVVIASQAHTVTEEENEVSPFQQSVVMAATLAGMGELVGR